MVTEEIGESLTQSAMLHLGDGALADVLGPPVQRAYMLTASTSTSALRLASLDVARHSLQTGRSRIGATVDAAERIRAKIRQDARFRIVRDIWDFDGVTGFDPLRISIDVRNAGLNGHAVRDELIRSDEIYTELATAGCIVAFLGPGLEPDGAHFLAALQRLGVQAAACAAQ